MPAIIAIIIIVLDQITKYLVATNMFLQQHIDFVFPYFSLYYIQNNGAAFSILQGKQTLLILFTVMVMIGIVAYLVAYRKSTSKLERFSLALILGGGVGNLIDRVLNGYVIDFIDIKIIPIFNVADIAITCGCILFAISILFSKKK